MRKTHLSGLLVIASVCLWSILFASCATRVTEEMLTPRTESSMVSLPRFYPIMPERQEFKDDFKLTKTTSLISYADVFYDDMKKMFRKNQENNFLISVPDNFGYIRCNSIDIKLKNNSWYLLPSICTIMYANLMGCPFVGIKVINEASFSILDCEGKEIKQYTIRGVGRSSGGIYTIGRDIGRFAYINANKDLLKKLNEAIQKDKHMLAIKLVESGREQRTKMQLGEKAVSVADRNYEKGVEALQKGKNEQAVLLFDRTLTRYPQHYMALFYRGVSLSNLGRYSKAIKDFKEASQINPQFADALYFLAFLQQKMKQYEAATVNVQRALALQGNEYYYSLYAALLQQDGYLEESKEQYKKILEINPDRIDVYEWIAKLDELIEAKKTMEEQQYMQLLNKQAQALQVMSQSLAPNQIQNPVQSYETGQAGQRSRESVSRDLDKARKLLSKMKRNSDRDKSNVDKVIYQRMIQRQEEKIRELEQELEKLDQ